MARDAAGTTKRSKKKLLIVVLAPLVLGFGAKTFLLSKPSPPVATDATATTVAGPIVGLDPMTISTADGRYVRLQLALQIKGHAEGEEPAVLPGAGEAETPNPTFARLQDLTIDVVGKKSYPDLVGDGASSQTREQLSMLINAASGGLVEEVYFIEFLVQ